MEEVSWASALEMIHVAAAVARRSVLGFQLRGQTARGRESMARQELAWETTPVVEAAIDLDASTLFRRARTANGELLLALQGL